MQSYFQSIVFQHTSDSIQLVMVHWCTSSTKLLILRIRWCFTSNGGSNSCASHQSTSNGISLPLSISTIWHTHSFSCVPTLVVNKKSPLVMCAAREGATISSWAWSQSSEHMVVSFQWLPCILSSSIHPVYWIHRLCKGDLEIAFSSVESSVNLLFQRWLCLILKNCPRKHL